MLRRLVLFGPLLALALLELWHPAHHAVDVYRSLAPRVEAWLAIHFAQLVLFPLAAVAVYLPWAEDRSPAAHASRIGLLAFVVFYTAMDAIAGIATGTLVARGHALGEELQPGFTWSAHILYDDVWIGGGGFSVLGALGTAGWLAGVTGAALALRGRPGTRVPALLLVGSGIALCFGHPAPAGTLAFALALAALVWLECRPGAAPEARGGT